MIQEVHDEHAGELLEAMSTPVPSQEAMMLDGPETAALDDGSLGNHVGPMEVDIATPSLAVLQQHGADEAQAMIQEAFDERARELEADMVSARRSFEAALRARGGR